MNTSKKLDSTEINTDILIYELANSKPNAMLSSRSIARILDLEQKLKQETLRREEAENVIEFYGDINNWILEYLSNGYPILIHKEQLNGGEKAREYLRKYKDEK